MDFQEYPTTSKTRMSNRQRTILGIPKPKRQKQSKLACAAINEGQSFPTIAMELPAPHYCDKCRAKKLGFESLKFCCCDGDVEISCNALPPELDKLYTSNDDDSEHFRTYSLLYNNLFAFSSIGGSMDGQTHKGIYAFKVHGQVYHYIPDLLPDNEPPQYLQLYFYDAMFEAENRLGLFPELRSSVIALLMGIMLLNPYAQFFKSLREIEVTEHTEIRLNKDPILDQRVYNAPTSDEVAVIWSEGTSSSQSNSPHIIVHGKSNNSHRIYHYYGCYDPLQYPLLFPRGDCGWHHGLLRMSHGGRSQMEDLSNTVISENVEDAADLVTEEGSSANRGKRGKLISCREYYAYKFQMRIGNFLLRAGRLFLQYIVDMYVKIENTRLDFFRQNQAQIRAELYQGLVDTIEDGEANASNVGQRVILPPSFLGGPRDMQRRYLNAIALVQRFGKPDLFITMTCNPNWPEIKAELTPGEKAQNRPDLLARVFRAKLIALKKKINEDQVFGEVAAFIYVVEFQKRGLPHVHMLLILKPKFKIKHPESFDKYVCAEIPSRDNPHLRKVVLGHMMHGPCGKDNPECQCMKHRGMEGKCKYDYPKSFSDITTSHESGYPEYRRRDTGESIVIRRKRLDNRWVIPYNPYLSALFDCHLNVEVCSTIQAVKYLYKYVYKGHDRVSYNVPTAAGNAPVNEIEQFQAGRWVSPCEAAWRIFGFDLFEMTPSVLALQVHLPNQHTVRFSPTEQLANIVSDRRRARTSLTEFFRMNTAFPNQPKYTYVEFCEYYTWTHATKTWSKRAINRISIGRLTFVAPSEGERYFLRLLLINVRGPKSFEDLRTVNGQLCASFQEAALKLGLLAEDDAVDKCMSEAVTAHMPTALRKLFATILIFGMPKDPLALWQKYYPHLSEDFRHQNPGMEAKVKVLTVQGVERFLDEMGKTLEEFGLGVLLINIDSGIRQTKDIADALTAPVPTEYIEAIDKLNPGQRDAFDCIIKHVQLNKSASFFIDGPGGTGKTYLYCALYAAVRKMGKIVLPTATSGIAASNIVTGRTAHSRFKIPLDHTASMACNVSKQSSLAGLLRESSLIIWDEASMAIKENVESLDLLLRDLCDNRTAFGGKVVVFGGDFRQVLPVVPKKTQKEAVQASLVSSYLWNGFKRIRLSENMRARSDPVFSDFLLALGDGRLQTEEIADIPLPSELVVPFEDEDHSVDQLVSQVFPELSVGCFSSSIFAERAILTPLNDDVDEINSLLIAKHPGEAVSYKSFDVMIDEHCNIYTTEFLNTLCPGGMSPHELVLKENCPVILLRNLAPASGLCNGTRLICKRFYPNLIQCVIATGHHSSEYVFLPRIDLRPSTSTNYPFQFQRKQFPIKLCFAMTINKAQGQTLTQVGIYLRRPCFSHGQLYVGLSRARKSKHVRVLIKPTSPSQSLYSAKNVISFEILLRAGVTQHSS